MTALARPSGPEPLHRAADSAVIHRSLADPERFAEIFDTYFDEIHRYAVSRVGLAAAEDVVSETFLAAFRKRARYDPERGAVRTWLYGIATNLVGKHRRAEGQTLRALGRQGVERPAEGHEDRVLGQVSAAQVRPELARAIGRLSDGERDVLLLMALAGLRHEEIAAALEIPYGTVGSRLYRARQKLREVLGGTDPMLDVKEDDRG
ncbi:RNA polymerase sigma factor [Actinomadura rudentiformis]|uniref:RNA polymerase sigma factor n=1 Tax=Actinomadura rudentiformis TaxID=359158 RepID=A0A6H9YUA5_9ACTN|nr:RNA polymerase sigma factor [Actinomadura rudentiformis]KAB2344127.1 RNA polymerase sigma factor [Actinomadura rudentiformis]